MKQAAIWLSALSACSFLSAGPQALAHEETENWLQASASRTRPLAERIPSREVELTEAEREAGVISFRDFLPTLAVINQRYRVYSPQDFRHFVENFHYPFRQRFDLQRIPPPTHVVLHWTANPRTDIPLYTLSAFLRRRQGGRIVERPNAYKNVSNYFLTGSLAQGEDSREAQLVKLTRGDLSSWGDIPRVTAYPTGDAWDDNKYDGRGALGIEIESPNFGSFYQNPSQREKLHNFLVLVLKERGVLESFAQLRESPEWQNLCRLQAYLQAHLKEIDVQPNGSIGRQWQLLHLLSRNLPGITPETLTTARQIFNFISGHGVVAHEYNTRMLRAGRPREADYDKIDFTEPHVFLVAMDLLQSNLEYQGRDNYAGFDLATRRLIESQQADNSGSEGPELPPALSDLEGPPMLFYQRFPQDTPDPEHEPR